MPAPAIDALPSAPQRTQSPTEFSAAADAWAAALPGFTEDANGLATWMEQRAADAEAAATAAEAAADAVDTAAAQAATGLPLLASKAGRVLTVVTAEDAVAWERPLPPGLILFVESDTAPTGTLKANGATVSRTTYAALFAVIGTRHGSGDGSTTFALPDYRGRFVRALDDGAGIDTGRTLGSAQAGAIEGHTHASGTLSTGSAGSHTHSYTSPASSLAGGGSGNFYVATGSGTTGSSGSHTHTMTGSTASTGGAETRPVNRAALAVITY